MTIQGYQVSISNNTIHITGQKMPPTVKEVRYILNKLIREKKADETYRIIT